MLKLVFADADSCTPAMPVNDAPDVEVWRDVDGTVCAYSHTVNGNYWMHLPGLARFGFESRNSEVKAISDPRVRRDSILDAYYRSVLPMALQAQGAEVLHASAVLTPRGVVALCARSGTGKSRLAYGLSRRGHPLWADDAVAFESSAAHIDVRPLPFSIRLRPDAATFFDQAHIPLSLALIPPDSITQVEDRLTPLAALIVLERFPLADRRAQVAMQRLAPVRAFTELLTHAYCFSLHNPERKERKVPVFKLRFRTGLENLEVILERISRLIEDDGE